MKRFFPDIGFQYFKSEGTFLLTQLQYWIPILKQLGARYIVFMGGFDLAVNEDIIQTTFSNEMVPIIHFSEELPLVKDFNHVKVLLNAYAKWGVKSIILGNKPNIKTSWSPTGWRYENLVDHFLDRFIPLAHYATAIGIKPVFPPLQPGGDYWDTAFLELALEGLERRQLSDILNHLVLACSGATFGKNLEWGKGGPGNWPQSKPYNTPEGQQDQIGFRTFEWYKTISRKTLQHALPLMILNCGSVGNERLLNYAEKQQHLSNMEQIITACQIRSFTEKSSFQNRIDFPKEMRACMFSLEMLQRLMEDDFTAPNLEALFAWPSFERETHTYRTGKNTSGTKVIEHYLLLPKYHSGVSDAILNKIRPFIKRFHPTVGFSLSEAEHAQHVSVFPDYAVISLQDIEMLRSKGCRVDVLPDSGIEIATLVNGISLDK